MAWICSRHFGQGRQGTAKHGQTWHNHRQQAGRRQAWQSDQGMLMHYPTANQTLSPPPSMLCACRTPLLPLPTTAAKPSFQELSTWLAQPAVLLGTIKNSCQCDVTLSVMCNSQCNVTQTLTGKNLSSWLAQPAAVPPACLQVGLHVLFVAGLRVGVIKPQDPFALKCNQTQRFSQADAFRTLPPPPTPTHRQTPLPYFLLLLCPSTLPLQPGYRSP